MATLRTGTKLNTPRAVVRPEAAKKRNDSGALVGERTLVTRPNFANNVSTGLAAACRYETVAMSAPFAAQAIAQALGTMAPASISVVRAYRDVEHHAPRPYHFV